MTTRFRLDRIQLDTTEGKVSYEFPSDLTVLAGPTGVGKTTLLEMIKFAFGSANALLAPVVRQHVNSVNIEVTLGQERLRLSRSVDGKKQKTVRVFDLAAQHRLPDHHISNDQPSLNSLLLGCLGLPDNLKAAARGGASTKAGSRITFNDIFSFLYVPQAEINRDIASSQDSYLDPKRKAVFELLFGLTDTTVLGMRSRTNSLTGEITVAENAHRTVLEFLRDSNTVGRIETEEAQVAAVRNERLAEADLAVLKQTIDPVTDRETQVMRDLLTEAERSLADARSAVIQLVRQQTECVGERRRVQADLDRLRRMHDAGERLADIEFSVCPRCMQALANRHVPDGACRLCLQPDPVARSDDFDRYEVRQLEDQLAEMDTQFDFTAEQLGATNQAVSDREKLVADLTANLDARTADRITPRLQAYSDASEQLAAARAEQTRLEATLRQWDRADDLWSTVERLRTERESLRASVKLSEENLEGYRREVLDSLDEEFRNAVRDLGVPGVESASIHRENYLPLLNGQPFSKFSRGGGIVTATQVAYWTSLLAVAFRYANAIYPTFLLIDSPRLALNTAEGLAAALYRRLVTQADANPKRVQIIVADNELPHTYRKSYGQLNFSYDHATVSSVRHPGPASVRTLLSNDDEVGDDSRG